MIALALPMLMLCIIAKRDGDTPWSDRSSYSSSWRRIATARRSTRRVPAGRLAVHLPFEPLEHVEGVLLERAEETLCLNRWSTGVVRTEGTLRGRWLRCFDWRALAGSSDVGDWTTLVGTFGSKLATAALGSHVSRQGRVNHCTEAKAQLSKKYRATASCLGIVRAECVSCHIG